MGKDLEGSCGGLILRYYPGIISERPPEYEVGLLIGDVGNTVYIINIKPAVL
jgi:hypothetical protein